MRRSDSPRPEHAEVPSQTASKHTTATSKGLAGVSLNDREIYTKHFVVVNEKFRRCPSGSPPKSTECLLNAQASLINNRLTEPGFLSQIASFMPVPAFPFARLDNESPRRLGKKQKIPAKFSIRFT
jgi:hypothetical protein